ncbi:MAG: site-specific integrase [Anaerolineaceae bacterium]|nr:site-specific integrase [Anaerolineaceae bacterium]
MSLSSISNQVMHALDQVTWDKEKIEAYQKTHDVISVKRSLRPGGDPTKGLPAILGINTRRTYFQTATAFFKRAEDITGEGLLSKLMNQDIFMTTFEECYQDAAPGTVNKLLAAIEKVQLGCNKLGWTKKSDILDNEMRAWVKTFRDDSDVRSPRFGYRMEDAERIIEYLKNKNSVFALPAELALRCGLREDEIAGLRGENVDVANQVLHIKGKGGKWRQVPIPEDLMKKLNTSKQHLFTPSASWRSSFRQTVRNATRALEIELSGVHRLRSNYAQNKYMGFLKQGMNDWEARRQVSELLGHGRIDVTFKYVPKGMFNDENKKLS